MKTNYEIYFDYEDDTLEIVKQPSAAPVDFIEGKYGICFYRDISDNIVKITIPEADVLFGVDRSIIENFLVTSFF